MDERELIARWTTARNHIVLSQIAPTFLLAVSLVLFVLGVATQPVAVRLAMTGILLASGILGAVVQITAASEGLGAVRVLAALPDRSPVAQSIVDLGWTMQIVRIVTPIIFLAVFAAEIWALFAA